MVNDINKFLRIRQLLTASCVHLFVLLLKRFYFEVVKLLLPGIRPALTLSIPNSWAGLGFTILNTGNINLTIHWHIHISISKKQFIRMPQRKEKLFCQNWLQVETVLKSKYLLSTICVCFTSRNIEDCPLVFVSPSRYVRENLRFSRSTTSPKHDTRVGTLKVW